MYKLLRIATTTVTIIIQLAKSNLKGVNIPSVVWTEHRLLRDHNDYSMIESKTCIQTLRQPQQEDHDWTWHIEGKILKTLRQANNCHFQTFQKTLPVSGSGTERSQRVRAQSNQPQVFSQPSGW